MILHRIELTHVGPFRDTATLGPFSPGLNVLSAANETGKSTLLMAAARALFDKHTTKGEELKGLQPVGTDLSPRVVVDFETAAGRFQIEKSFLQSPRSLCRQWRDDAWQLVAEADAADLRVQSLLSSTFPGRGASNASHWGFLGFLWARQGEPVEWPNLEASELGQKIRHRLARVEIDAVIEQLKNQIGKLADLAITSTGQAKVGGPLRRAEEAVAAIQAELTKVRQTREDLDASHQRYHATSAEVSRLEREEIDLTRQMRELSDQANEVERLRTELEARTRELAAVKERLQTVMNDATAMAERTAELQPAQEAVMKSEKEAQDATAAHLRLRTQVDELERNRTASEAENAKQRERHQRTQALLKIRQARAEADSVAQISRKVDDAAAQLAVLQERKAKLSAITSAKLKKLEELAQALRDAKAQLQALGITVELTPTAKTTVEITEPAGVKTDTIAKGETHVIQRPQTLELNLHGWGRVVVRSGSKEVQELTKDVAATEDEFHEALRDGQVLSVDAARDAIAARKELETQIKAATDTLSDRLGAYEDAAELKKELTTANGRIAVLEQALGVTAEEQAVSNTDLEITEARQSAESKATEAALKAFDKQLSQLRERERAAVEANQKAQQELAGRQTRLRTLETQTTDLLSRYPRGIEAVKGEIQTAFYEAESRLNGIRGKLPPDFASLPDRARRAALALQQVTNELRTRRTEQAEINGSLKTLGGQGLYSRETELVERLTEAESERLAAQTLAWAARMTHDLIEYRKQAATKAVLAPLEQRLSAAFAELTGVPSRQVFLDESLSITGVGRNREEAHPFALLSQGAREQLLLCLRIAVAQELASTEPQTLILDDVLVNTDPVRQERVLATLASIASRLQVVILTCHPDRYRGVGTTLALSRIN